jgi:hypothetical protein
MLESESSVPRRTCSAHSAGTAALRSTRPLPAFEFLKQLLEVKKDMVTAENSDDERCLDERELVDTDRGALTQILEEYAPPHTPIIVENVAEQIDALVRPIRGQKWQETPIWRS